jgi:hypothetical protein
MHNEESRRKRGAEHVARMVQMVILCSHLIGNNPLSWVLERYDVRMRIKFSYVGSEVLAAYSSSLKMEATCSSKPSVDFNGVHGVSCQKMEL